MIQNQRFPQQAAYFSLAAPFLGDFILNISKDSSKAPSSQLIIYIALTVLLLSGFSLGIYATLKSKGVKKILIPAILGVILHVTTAYIAYASYKSVIN